MKSSLRQKIAPLFCKLKILKVQDLFTHEIEKNNAPVYFGNTTSLFQNYFTYSSKLNVI